jgi:hypothetical protein
MPYYVVYYQYDNYQDTVATPGTPWSPLQTLSKLHGAQDSALVSVNEGFLCAVYLISVSAVFQG